MHCRKPRAFDGRLRRPRPRYADPSAQAAGRDDGAGFYPDFVVCVEGRPGSGIALLEPKGEHLWGKDSEVDKSAAVHVDHGRVFMVGRKRGERGFVFLRELAGKLQNDGAFSIDRLRFT